MFKAHVGEYGRFSTKNQTVSNITLENVILTVVSVDQLKNCYSGLNENLELDVLVYIVSG